jgi:hypothetical protein
VAGCTSGGGKQPSWAGALGSGVTVDSPRSASAGNDSPQGVLIGVSTAFSTGNFTSQCKYLQPSARSGCTSDWGSPDLRMKVDLADYPTFKNLKVGYTAIDGDRALVGFTGTACILKMSPSCFTNKNPAAVLDSGKLFSALWSQSHASTGGNAYSLSSAIKVNGKWYAYAVNESIMIY